MPVFTTISHSISVVKGSSESKQLSREESLKKPSRTVRLIFVGFKTAQPTAV